MTPRTPRLRGLMTFCTATFICAGQVSIFAQISPCGAGQQLGNNAVITSGSPAFFSGSYVSAGNLSVNVAGGSVTGNANVTIRAGTAICLGPGFQAAGTASGGGFTAQIGPTPPAGAIAITTASLPGANQGAYYQQPLAASGGVMPYNWFQNGGSLPAGLSLTSGGVVQGNPGAGGNYVFVAQVQDAAGATATQVLSITVSTASPVTSLSINGGSSSGETLATLTVPFAFGIYDPSGANDVAYAQFWVDNGSTSCYGDWGRPNALDLYDGNTGATYGYNMYQADSFCTVSLGSITNSPTDPTEVAVVLNFTFNPGFSGSYTILEQVNYASGIQGSWQSVGTLVIDPPPSVSPQPTVTLTDNTQSSGAYVAGDSFTLTVTGPPNQPVSLNLNGVAYGIQGYTNSGGVYSLSGAWTTANVGNYVETWYVESVLGAPSLLLSISPANDTSGPASLPNSFTAIPPTLACGDVTGNWIATPSSGPQSEWDLTQSGNTVNGMAYESASPACGVFSFSVTGEYSSPSFSLTASNPTPAVDACGNAPFNPDKHTISLSGNSCSLGSGQYSNIAGSGTVAWQAKKASNTVTPTSTATTAHYNISYASYIAVDNVLGPTPCPYFPPGQQLPVAWPVLYKGDAYRGTYRTTQSVIVIPNAARDYNFYFQTGPTRNYGFGSPVNGSNANLDSYPLTSDIYLGNYGGLDEDPTGLDCYKWNARGHSPTDNMQIYSASYPYSTQAQVHLYGFAANPLEPGPPITWDMNVVIDDSSPTNPTAYVSYNHTCYPAHIVKVNGTKIYEYVPGPNANNPVYIGGCLLGIGKIIGQSYPPVAVPTQ